MTHDEATRRAIESCLDLFNGSGAHAFILPVPNTRPTLFIVCGEKEQIENLLASTSTTDQKR